MDRSKSGALSNHFLASICQHRLIVVVIIVVVAVVVVCSTRSAAGRDWLQCSARVSAGGGDFEQLKKGLGGKGFVEIVRLLTIKHFLFRQAMAGRGSRNL